MFLSTNTATLILCLFSTSATALYMPILDEESAYPLLANADTGLPVTWSQGSVARYRSGSRAIHVSDRGIRFIASSALITDEAFWGNIGGHASILHTSCRHTSKALCVTDQGSFIFATQNSLAQIPDTASKITDPFTRTIGSLACKRNAKRQITNTNSYAVSLCDVTQNGAEILLKDSTVYYLHHSEPFWFFAVVSICIIMLVTALAENISSLLQRKAEEQSIAYLQFELFLAVLLSVLSLLQQPYFTVTDYTAFLFLCVYISVYFVFWNVTLYFQQRSVSQNQPVEHETPINVLLGALLLSTCRVYHGLESPYVFPVFLLLAIRTFEKTLRYDQKGIEVFGYHAVLLFMDYVLLALTHQYGFRPLFFKPYTGDVYSTIALLFCFYIAKACV